MRSLNLTRTGDCYSCEESMSRRLQTHVSCDSAAITDDIIPIDMLQFEFESGVEARYRYIDAPRVAFGKHSRST
jgi:hypothetical protein